MVQIETDKRRIHSTKKRSMVEQNSFILASNDVAHKFAS
jgi:hypothetical protein